MLRIIRTSVVLVGLLIIAQAFAWAGPVITWTDAVGFHQVDLILIANPDYNASDPDISPAESMMVWAPYGSYSRGYKNGYISPLNIDMDSVNAMSFFGSGNFMQDGPDGMPQIWGQIKLRQQITNNTNYSWTDFHITSTGARFYKIWENQSGWDAIQHTFSCDFDYAGGVQVAPGQIFYDGIDIKLLTPDAQGNAGFTLQKWPTYVPEPGSAAALLSGIIGFAAFALRRKA